MLLEYFCLFVFILRLFHVWCFAAGVKFWRDKKNVIFLSIIVVGQHAFLYTFYQFPFQLTNQNILSLLIFIHVISAIGLQDFDTLKQQWYAIQHCNISHVTNFTLFSSYFNLFPFYSQLTFIDMIMYIIFKEAELPVHTVRWTRVFRPLFLINISEGRQVRNNKKK